MRDGSSFAAAAEEEKEKEKALWILEKKKVRDPQEQKTFYARKKQGGARRSFVLSFKKLGTGYYTHGLCNSHSQREKEVRVLRAMQSTGHARCGRASSFSSALSKNSGKTYFDANIEITVLPVIEQILHLIKA